MSKWKQDSLTNHVSLITKGTTPTSIGKEFQENGINFIKAESITDAGKFISSAFAFIDDSTNEVLKRSQLQNGDILFSIAGVLGRVAVVNKDILPANTNQAIAIIRLSSSSEIENDFLKHLLNSEFVKDQIRRINVQAAQANFSLADINRLQIKFPEETKEQTKIARILSTADSVIEKTQAAIAKYKAIKQGMLQDLFTRGIDITTNKLRPRFEDAPQLYKESKLGMIPREWEVEILSSVVEIISGGTPSTHVKEYWNGEIPWLSVDDFNTGNRYATGANKKITEEGLKNSATNFLLPGMLIISARGTVGVISQMKNPMTFNQSCYGLNSISKDLDNDFLYYFLLYYKMHFGFNAYGSVFDAITRNSFDEVFIPINKVSEEQKLIVERLTAIDNKLQTEQTYLQKMQSLKKGLMEDLLSGKKEVNIKKEQNKKQVREYGQ